MLSPAALRGRFSLGDTVPRAEKEERVRGIAERLSAAEAAILTDYRGLTVQDAAELRAALADVDTRFSVVKNSLTRLAVKQAGLEDLTQYVDGVRPGGPGRRSQGPGRPGQEAPGT
jgi:hypothetical protein